VDINWQQIAKFHENILSRSENIANSFGEGYFFDSHCRLNKKLKTRKETARCFILVKKFYA